ncbi:MULTISPECIES: hypothetical protein [Nguyenibacter]|uniref:DUF1311 domain-containing protein n=1 Tax=Nguyenibacter vanlangensis TaxID=1216886 RepID=A0A7Y7IX05_9PROT|nr:MULTISPECIES: hypothetical protein [Nguyenibacter]NVN11727.1 hypothetical protein [Nguyenibacter vanlangensis]WRH86364.1 hypothetical protein QN315_09900 [Nguyenibacter sp. L1]
MSFPIRRAAMAGMALAGFLNGQAAMAADACTTSPAHEAFDVQGLKSELMVTALSCNMQDRYNSFVAQFRGTLLAEENTLNGYFRATYGRSAQREHDDYITQLANVQSERGLKAGTAFCNQRAAMFDEVAVLDTPADLSSYAQAKDIIQPASYETCIAPERSLRTEIRTRYRGRRTHSTRS